MDGKYLDMAGSHVTARVLQVSGAHIILAVCCVFCYFAYVLVLTITVFVGRHV